MTKRITYLDYNATAPIRPEVIETMSTIMAEPHNASAVHTPGRNGRKYIEDARQSIAALTGTPAAQIIFNSGATEANNTVLKHFETERILISAIEHPSILEAHPNAETIPVTKDGTLDLNTLEDLLKQNKTALVSVMLVNNETGIIQPIKAIADLTHSNGALLHCDAVQAAGRIPINMPEMGIDFLSLSAHKLGGPQGVGALCLGLCGTTPTLLHGGGQEKSARAGTENVAGIAGFGIAANFAQQNMTKFQTQTTTMREALEKTLSTIDGLTIHGKEMDRVGNTTLITLPGLSSETLLMAFDLEGIAISNGSACSSGKVEPSHVLKAMGLSNEDASSALRISTGWASKEEDIETFLKAFQNIYTRMKP